jgi:rubrerythrin
VSAAPIDRRAVLRGAVTGAGAIAAAGLVVPALSRAQSPADEDLRDFLVEAIALEQVTVLAYATAADAAGGELATTLERFRDQEQAHANALRAALDSLGFDPPEPPDSPADTGVLDGVEGLSDETAARLTTALEDLDGLERPEEILAEIQKLETEQLRFYIAQGPVGESVDLSTTSAEIAGCQAQHLIAVRQELGETPEEAVSAVTRAADPAAPTADTDGE